MAARAAPLYFAVRCSTSVFAAWRRGTMGRASMLLAEPPPNPHVEAAISAAHAKKQERLQAALAIEPAIDPAIERLLLNSMAQETGSIPLESDERGWTVKRRRPEPEPERAPPAQPAQPARRAATSHAEGSERWWSTTSESTVAGSVGGLSAQEDGAVGPTPWWPNTTMFKRRDSLVALLNDKSLSAAERQSKRISRSRSASREQKDAVRRSQSQPSLHVKHYGKMCLVREDQRLPWRDSETFAVEDELENEGPACYWTGRNDGRKKPETAADAALLTLAAISHAGWPGWGDAVRRHGVLAAAVVAAEASFALAARPAATPGPAADQRRLRHAHVVAQPAAVPEEVQRRDGAVHVRLGRAAAAEHRRAALAAEGVAQQQRSTMS